MSSLDMYTNMFMYMYIGTYWITLKGWVALDRRKDDKQDR
jgi:hypothetical protein